MSVSRILCYQLHPKQVPAAHMEMSLRLIRREQIRISQISRNQTSSRRVQRAKGQAKTKSVSPCHRASRACTQEHLKETRFILATTLELVSREQLVNASMFVLCLGVTRITLKRNTNDQRVNLFHQVQENDRISKWIMNVPEQQAA